MRRSQLWVPGLFIAVLSVIVATFLLFMRQTPDSLSSASNGEVIGVSSEAQPSGNAVQRASDIPLLTAEGQETTLARWSGKWLVLYFGYASCPDVCPLSLSYLRKELRSLRSNNDAAAQQLQAIFVSVDPERDQPQTLQRYVQAFDKSFIGLTGSSENLQKLARQLGVYYALEKSPDQISEKAEKSEKTQKATATTSSYTVVHSGAFFILSPRGELVKTLSPPQAPGDLSEALRTLLAGGVH
jgi:protein SCO1/2